jgi:hypothetical protein
VTIRSEPARLHTEPGSSAPRYDGSGQYDASAEAMSTVHALERAYGLSEVSAWPISALHVHCVVFRISPAQAASIAIAQLSRDARVQSVEVLNQFEARSKSASAR